MSDYLVSTGEKEERFAHLLGTIEEYEKIEDIIKTGIEDFEKIKFQKTPILGNTYERLNRLKMFFVKCGSKAI